MSGGPLCGVRIVEFAGIGPAPFGSMLLTDLGADVIRIERGAGPANGQTPAPPADPVLDRGKRSLALDLKRGGDRDTALALLDEADIAIDPYRPGVLERLRLDPEMLMARNPGLIVARITGWGQDGPMSAAAGHDINFIALAGALEAIGPADVPPVVPLNLVGDYAAGGLMLAFGVACALFERTASGKGQVLDVAMVDGVASMMAVFCQMLSQGSWSSARGEHWLHGSAHWYGAYETADHRYLTVGSLEAPFYDQLLTRLGLDPEEWPQWDRARWPALRARLADVFSSQPLRHWESALEGSDVCFAPALSLSEAFAHPHIVARGTYVAREGTMQPAPAPRFSRTPGAIAGPAPTWDADGPTLRRRPRWDGAREEETGD